MNSQKNTSFQIPKDFNSSEIMEPINNFPYASKIIDESNIIWISVWSIITFEILNSQKNIVKKEEWNNEPKEQSEMDKEKQKNIFEQAIDYLNTLKPKENNQELATKISQYINDNELSSENIPKIYNLLKN